MILKVRAKERSDVTKHPRGIAPRGCFVSSAKITCDKKYDGVIPEDACMESNVCGSRGLYAIVKGQRTVLVISLRRWRRLIRSKP